MPRILCPKCNLEHWTWENCLKRFYFKHEYYGDELIPIGALDFEDAAERFAKMYNERTGEYPLMQRDDFVEIYYNQETKRFKISAEPVICYNVEEQDN